MRGPLTALVVLLVLAAGCRADPSPAGGATEPPGSEIDADTSAEDGRADPSDPAPNDRDDGPDEAPSNDAPSTPGEGLFAEHPADGGVIGPYVWDLSGTSPDGRHLVVQTTYGGCPRFEGWEHLEEPDRVVVVARMWRPDDPPGCDDVGREETTTIELDEPLGDRRLVGCQHGECRTGPFTSSVSAAGSHEIAAAEGTLVVNVSGDQWSLDPGSGSAHLRWSEVGNGMLHARVGPGVSMTYDGNLGIDVVDTITGEVRFTVAGQFMGFAGDVFLSCRGQGPGDADDVRAVTEAHDVATGELRWEVPVGCHQLFDTDGEVVTFGGRPGWDGPEQQLVVDIADGTERARVDVGPNAAEPVLLDDEVFLHHRQGTFLAIDTVDGATRELDATGRLLGGADETLIVLGDAAVEGRSPDDGRVLWEREVDPGQTDTAVAGDAVFVTDGPVGEVVRLDPATGDERWTTEVGRTADTDVAVHDDTVFVATTTAVVALDLTTGERRWWTSTLDRR